MKKADANETLQQFLDEFTGDYKGLQPVKLNFSTKYNGLAYEIKDPTTYTDMGGARIYSLAIERNEPEYPGMKLETPQEMPKVTAGKPAYFIATKKFGRLHSKLYYLVMLDSCEFIHDESVVLFNNFLENIVVE
jgi:hypothetical protein